MFSSSFSVNDTTYRDTRRRKNERRKNDDRSIDAFRKPLNRHQPYPIVQPSSPFSLFPLRVESPREDRKNLERGSAARVVEYLFKPRFQPPAPEEVGDRWKCIRPPRTCGMQNKNVNAPSRHIESHPRPSIHRDPNVLSPSRCALSSYTLFRLPSIG